jgi:hypothetical protein
MTWSSPLRFFAKKLLAPVFERVFVKREEIFVQEYLSKKVFGRLRRLSLGRADAVRRTTGIGNFTHPKSLLL